MITMQPSTQPDRPVHRKVYENPTIGDKAVFLQTSAETGGAYTLLEIELAAGGGNPLHAHRTYTETFIPVEGELEVQLGKERKLLRPGETCTVPLRAVHCFRNPSDKPIRFRVKLVPGNEGFEYSVMIAYGLAKDGLTNREGMPKNLAYAAVLLHFFDPEPTGMLRLMMPFLRWKARQARKRGVEQELIDRYCR
ncbi:MAG: cupin domain-containing protein [Cytophagales bacterium]|nr:cupin domain-containing protein [Cytophagales bacterium]